MSYPLSDLAPVPALDFIGKVFFEVLFLESIHKQLPAKVKTLLEQGISRRARQLMPYVSEEGKHWDARARTADPP